MPTTFIALGIVVVAVLPGSVYTWAYERQASAYGVTFADRSLRFIALSLIFHVILGWPEYFLYRAAFSGEKFAWPQFLAAWLAAVLLLALPAAAGTALGGLYATRTSRQGWVWLRKRLSEPRERKLLQVALGRTPAPRAWDNFFSDRPTTYLRVRTTEGVWIAGLFADGSYAGGYPHEADLFLEDGWRLDEDGNLVESLRYPVYIAASEISYIEVVPQQAKDAD